MTYPHLVIDNSRVDPTLPDIYDGFAHDDCEVPPGAAIAMLGAELVRRALVWSVLIAVGVVIGHFA